MGVSRFLRKSLHKAPVWLFCFALSLLAVTQLANAEILGKARMFKVGEGPIAIASADANGDGLPDIVEAEGQEGTVRVLLNRGGQRFVEESTFNIGIGTVQVATGDFNGDGRADLAVVNAQAGTVSIALGTGDGSFLAPRAYDVGVGTSFALVIDVDRDGIPDLVLANPLEKNLTIWKGNGDGTFASASKVSLAALNVSPIGVAAVDFGGNGIIDLVVGNGTGNSITVLLGDSAGNFEFGNTYKLTCGSASAFVTADFDGDGIPDVAVSDSNGKMQILLGTNRGEFRTAVGHDVPRGIFSLKTADINGDGIPDLIAGGSMGVAVLLGNGDGTFRAAERYGELGVSAISVADFNHDGQLDVAAANTKSGGLGVLLNALQPTNTSLAMEIPAAGVNSIVARVSSRSGFPTGSILFRAGKKNLSRVALGQKASATLDLPAETALSAIKVTYLGDLFHLGSTASSTQSPLTSSVTPATPTAVITPSPISFGNQAVGISSSIVATIKNTGTSSLTLSSITLSGTNASGFSKSTTCKLGVAIAVGGSCKITVTSLPTSAGAKSAAITLVDDDPTSPQIDNITANAIDAPYISIVPSPAKFPPQGVGVPSAPLNVTLTNRGDMPLSISGLNITGTAASNYAVSVNNCTGLIAAGASCTIGLQFTPSTTGSRAGVLNITSNALNTPFKLNLSGTGINGANAVVSPTSLLFGSQGVGISATQVVTVSNTGNASLTVGTPTLGGTNPGDFSFSSGCSSVAIGHSCTISVTFTPPTTGALSATLTIPTNANILPAISLKGTGVNGPVVQLSPTSLNFGSQPTGQKSAAQTVALTNTGNAALVLTSFTMGGTNAADFQQTNTCRLSPNTIPIGGSCSLSFTFTPAAVGTRSATLTIKDNGVPTSQKVTLSGVGIQSPGGPAITVSLSPSAIQTFGSSNGTVNISSPAPAGGQQVFLSASNASIITMPTSVTVASGQTTATFTIAASNQAGSEVITGFATGYTSGTANLSIASRTTTLSLSSVIGLGRSVLATLTLATPAPAGGTTFTLTSGDTTVATISPTTVSVAAGSTTTTTVIQVNGVNVGATSVSASASGYTTSTASIAVTNNLITLGKSLTVAPGQTLPLPVSLSKAAPAGGITVDLASGNTGVATVSPASVFIAAGQTTPATSPQITGVAFGTAVFSGSDPIGQFAPDSSSVTVTITLTFSPATLSVNAGAVGNLTLSISAPAPLSGYTANLVVANTSLATAPPSVAFSAGVTSANVPVTGVAAGNTTIQATITGAPSASANITVNPPPAITLNAVTVGKNLEVANTGTLAAPAPAGNLTVTLTSSAATRMLLSADALTPGTSSITIQVPAGSSTFSYFVQGVTATGTANVTAAASGYATGSAVVTLAPSGFYIATPSVGTAVGAPDSTVTVSPAQLAPSTLTIAQAPVALRPGVNATITVNSSATSVGTIIGSPVTLAGGTNFGSVSFHAFANGTSNISVVQPTGYSKPSTSTSIVATVSASAFSAPGSITLGANLQTSVSAQLTTPAPAGNLDVTITSSDVSKLLLSTDPTVAGVSSITVQVPAGSTAVPTFWVQSPGSTGNVNVQMQASGVATDNIAILVAPSGFVLVASCDQSTFSTNVVSGDTTLYVLPEVLDPSTLQPTFVNNGGCAGSSQPLSPGVGPVSVNITSANTSIGTILTSPVSFNTNDTQQLTTFHPIAVGSTDINIDTPAGFSTPVANQDVSGTVTLSNIFLSTSSTGKDLQSQLGISLGAAAPPGNEQVTVTSADPSQVLLTTDPTAAGSPSVSVVVFAGTSVPSAPVYAQALNGSGTVNLTATAPDFGTVTTSIQLVPSGFVVAAGCAGYPISTTPFSADTQLTVYPVALDPATLNDTNLYEGCYPVGQPVRFGAAPVTVNVSTDNPGVGTITTSSLTFNAGDASQTTAFHPVADGTTNVDLAPVTGFMTPANYQQIAATVAAGTIAVSVPDLGKNLQSTVAVSLSTSTPIDENIILTSSDPTKLKLSTDPTVTGSSSVTITVSAGSGSSATTVYAQALSAAGTVSITASSADYSSTTVPVNLLPSGFVLSANGCIGNNSFSTTPLSNDVGISVYLTPLDPTTLNDTSVYSGCYQIPQMLAPEAGMVTIPVNSSNPGVGGITVTPLTFNPGDSQQASAFHAVSNGSSTISLGTPSVTFNTPSNYQSVAAAVTNGSINMSVGGMGEVGNNLEAAVTASLSVPAPAGGDTVTITSSDSTKLLLSVDPTAVGSSSISIPVAPGSFSISTFYAQALAGTGSVTLTASAASFDPQNVNVPLVPSGFVQLANCNLGNNPISTSVLAGDSGITIYSVPLDPTTLNLIDFGYCVPNAQALRPGVANVSVNVTSSNTAAGTVLTSPVVFTTNQASGTTGFHPVANGTTNVSVATPSGFNTPSNYRVTTYNVVPAPLYAPAVSVGKNMQVSASIGLGVAAPSGGLAVTVSSPNANVLFSTSPASLGSTSLTLNLNGGDTSTPSFYVQAKFPAPANVTYTSSAPGYATTSANISVLPSGFALNDGNASSFTTSVGAADVSLQVVPVSLDPSTLNVVDFETLLPGPSSTNTQVPVLTSGSCGGTLDQTIGQITVSPVVFNGDDNPDYQNTSFHAAATGSTVVYVGVPSSNYFRASNFNCITGNVN